MFYKFRFSVGKVLLAGLIISTSEEEAKASLRKALGLPPTYSGIESFVEKTEPVEDQVFVVYNGKSDDDS